MMTHLFGQISLKSNLIIQKEERFFTRNDKNTLFWRDPWVTETTLLHKFPLLFCLCEQQDISVAQVREMVSQLSFRR